MANSRFKLYNYAGALVYTFPCVNETNAPKPVTKSVIIEEIRGQGCIVIPGSTGSWDLQISGFLTIDEADEGYEEIVVKMDEMISAIPYNTRLRLRIYKTDSTYYTYLVKRVQPIEFPPSLRTDIQSYTVILKAESWVE